ncbi:MAG: GAF domain-containing protein [Chloroflexota bacterium]|nr:MAG: GAF domain-containing protein [Chloroflexota bacterium]
MVDDFSTQVEIALREATERLRLLRAIDRAILSAQSPQEISISALSYLKELVGCNRASIVLFDFKEAKFTVLAVQADNETKYGAKTSYPLEFFGGEIGVLQQGKTHLTPDILDEKQPKPMQLNLLAEGIRAFAHVPLLVQGELMGCLNIGASAPSAFNEDRLEIVLEVADSLAIALSQARLIENQASQLLLANTLKELGSLLTSQLALDEVLNTILDLLGRIVKYDSTSIMLAGENGPLYLAAGRSLPDPELVKQVVVDLNDHLLGLLDTSQDVVYIPDTRLSKGWVYYPGIEYIRSWIGAPLSVKGRLIGILNLDSKKVDAYDSATCATVRAFANQAAIAIENARLFEATRRNTERVALTSEILRSLNAEPDVMQAFSSVESALKAMTGCERVSLSLLQRERKSSNLFTLDLTLDEDSHGLQVGVSDMASSKDILDSLPHLAPDAAEISFRSEQILYYEGGFRSRINMPMRVRGEVVGTLNLAWRKPAGYDISLIPLLEPIANAVGLAVDRSQLLNETFQQAGHLITLNKELSSLNTALQLEKDHATLVSRALLAFTAGDVDSGLSIVLSHISAYLSQVEGCVILLDHSGKPERYVYSPGISGKYTGPDIEAACKGCEHLDHLSISFPENKIRVTSCKCCQDEGSERLVLLLPLAMNRHALGLFHFLVPNKFTLSKDTQAFLEQVSRAVSLGLSRLQLVDDLQEMNVTLESRVRQQTFELQVLHELAQDISYTLNYDELFRLILMHTQRVIDYDVAAGLIVDREEIDLYLWPGYPQTMEARVDYNRSLTGRFSSFSNLIIAPEQVICHHLLPVDVDLATPTFSDLKTTFQVPVNLGEMAETCGMLFIGSIQEDAFDENQIRLLHTIAYQASNAIQRMRTLLAGEQQRLETLVERLPAGVLLLNADKHMVIANPAARAYLPLLLDPQETGAPVTHLGRKPLDVLLQAAPGGVPHEIYTDGKHRKVFEIASRPIEAGPEAGGWILTLHDVTHERNLREETHRRLEQLHSLRMIDMAITGNMDLKVVLSVLLEQVLTQLQVDAADIILYNQHSQMLDYAAGRGFRFDTITHSSTRLGKGLAGRVALEQRLIQVLDLGNDAEYSLFEPQFKKEAFVSYFGVPLIAKGQLRGVLEVYHRQPFDPQPEWHDFLETVAGQAAIAIENAELFTSLQRSNLNLSLAYDATIEGWSAALDLRDRETEGHTRRVTRMTEQLAQRMGFGEQELVHIRRGALLHDIGKMGVPDQILLKPGALTEDEWQVMRKHPTYAYDLLYPITFLRPALHIPYCHHEKWDGTGYPRGLNNEQIPLEARIFALVDVWDALRSDRPYRKAWPEEATRGYIRDQAGRHFDPNVVDVFLSTLGME